MTLISWDSLSRTRRPWILNLISSRWRPYSCGVGFCRAWSDAWTLWTNFFALHDSFSNELPWIFLLLVRRSWIHRICKIMGRVGFTEVWSIRAFHHFGQLLRLHANTSSQDGVNFVRRLRFIPWKQVTTSSSSTVLSSLPSWRKVSGYLIPQWNWTLFFVTSKFEWQFPGRLTCMN